MLPLADVHDGLDAVKHTDMMLAISFIYIGERAVGAAGSGSLYRNSHHESCKPAARQPPSNPVMPACLLKHPPTRCMSAAHPVHQSSCLLLPSRSDGVCERYRAVWGGAAHMAAGHDPGPGRGARSGCRNSAGGLTAGQAPAAATASEGRGTRGCCPACQLFKPAAPALN